MSRAVPVAILAALVVLAFAGMWWGWKRRERRHGLPPLPAPTRSGSPRRVSEGRYFGSTVAGAWLDRVVARGLGARSECSMGMTEEGLVVSRPGREPFLLPHQALVGARRERGIAGKVIPPDGMLVITWRHGDHTLDSGFRLDDGDHDTWIREIDHLVKEHTQ